MDLAGTFVFAIEGAMAAVKSDLDFFGLMGAAVMIGGIQLGKPRPLMDVLGGVVCFLLRVVSVWQNWNLPKVRAMLFYF